MARQYREKWVSGAFVQQTGTNAPSSFTGLNASSQTNLRDLTLLNVESVARLNVASQSAFRDVVVANVTSLADLTISSLTGAAGWRGIGVLSATVAVTSIQASAAQSGAVIQLTIYNYSTVDSLKGVMVSSVGAGFFNVMCIQSTPPSAVMPFTWSIVR